MNILIVEDERRVRDFVARGLKAERHTVTEAANGTEGLDYARTGEFDVIVLDVMLPEVTGIEVCKTLRTENVRTPILMLTALDDVSDTVEGFRAGADDYLTKPFHFEELLVRLEALIRRRAAVSTDTTLCVGNLSLNCETMEVYRGGVLIKLTAKEIAILELFMRSPGKVISRQRILSSVWGMSEDPLTNVVDVYMARLRKRIDFEGAVPMIETVRGHGYKIANVTL